MNDQDRYMWPIWANSRLTLWIHWERIRRHPSTVLSIGWPVSTIGSVSDYDSIGNQEVAGSSPVLVTFFPPATLGESRSVGRVVFGLENDVFLN